LEKEFDVIVMYDMVAAISPEQQKAFEDLLQTGIGVVSLHHNLGAHRNWDEFRKIIGGKFMFADCEIDGRKYSKSTFTHGQDVKVHVADKEHPITRDLQDFEIHDEVYGKCYVSPEVHVLLTTDHPKSTPEIAWTYQYGKSRVFYLMLGHDAKAWSHPSYPAIVLRGIQWAALRQGSGP
jgi:type 1 glutamine amidotransferase